MKNRLKAVWPVVFFFCAMLMHRHQMLRDMNLTYASALSMQLYLGWLYDLVVALMATGLAVALYGVTRLPRFWGWLPLALLGFFGSAANVTYLRFFGSRLDFWVLRLHGGDIFHVSDSAGQLSSTLPILISFALFVTAGVFAWRWSRSAADARPTQWYIPRLKPVLAGAGLVFCAMLLRQSPIWFHLARHSSQSMGNVLTQQILTVWYDELTGWQGKNELHAMFRARRRMGTTADMADAESRKRSVQTLAEYREFKETGFGWNPKESSAINPLLTRFHPNPAETKALRAKLGMKGDGPVNVVVLFLESLRSFEFDHPEIGPLLMPRLHKIFAEHAIRFKTTYTSSFNAGQTVRGQFMTLCSMIDNMRGPAVYIYYNTLSVKCAQGFFKDHGYETAWFNSYDRNFHNKSLFESLHGMNLFFDGPYFESKGITERITTWGHPDKPFLKESLKVLEDLTAPGKKPLFAHLLTITTHHPYFTIAEGPVPAPLAKMAESYPAYLGYLSRLKYTDDAVSDFLEAFFKSPAADNTVLWIQGDHGTPEVPPMQLTAVQRHEMPFRILAAMVSKNLKKPETITYPVHQVDVIPTLATIAGFSGETAWLGRNMFSGEGHPWFYQQEGNLGYRTKNRGCYSSPEMQGTKCFDLSGGKDPLYEPVREIAEIPEMTQFFHRLVTASSQVIELNLIQRRLDEARIATSMAAPIGAAAHAAKSATHVR